MAVVSLTVKVSDLEDVGDKAQREHDELVKKKLTKLKEAEDHTLA